MGIFDLVTIALVVAFGFFVRATLLADKEKAAAMDLLSKGIEEVKFDMPRAWPICNQIRVLFERVEKLEQPPEYRSWVANEKQSPTPYSGHGADCWCEMCMAARTPYSGHGADCWCEMCMAARRTGCDPCGPAPGATSRIRANSEGEKGRSDKKDAFHY